MTDIPYQPRSPLAALCDKCGGIVPPENSTLQLEEMIGGPIIGNVRDRHLFPIRGCEGSPSRVKLVQTNEKWGRAYQQLQQTTNASNSKAS